MANTIALATKYTNLLDEAFAASTKTDILEKSTAVEPNFDGSNSIKIYKLSFGAGLGSYSRTNGHSAGTVTGAWETMTLTQDRSKSFVIDAMDDEETLDLTVGNTFSEFMRTYITPEVDAYRFSKIASTTNVTSNNAAVNANSVISLIDTAQATLTEAGVPEEGRIMYMNTTVYNLLKANTVTNMRFSDGSNLDRRFKTFDGMECIVVPQARFYSKISIDSSNGFAVDTTNGGTNIQFMVVDPTAIVAVKKHVKLRIFSPDVYQDADAYKIDYRIYHDCFVYDNKVKGVYVQKAAVAG